MKTFNEINSTERGVLLWFPYDLQLVFADVTHVIRRHRIGWKEKQSREWWKQSWESTSSQEDIMTMVEWVVDQNKVVLHAIWLKNKIYSPMRLTIELEWVLKWWDACVFLICVFFPILLFYLHCEQKHIEFHEFIKSCSIEESCWKQYSCDTKTRLFQESVSPFFNF